MISDKSDLVVKSNRLIEASYRLTLVEQRIVLAAIVEARESQTGLRDSHVSLEARRFCALFGMHQDNVYNQLKEALETLYKRSITVRDVHPETGKERVTSMRWISSHSYIDGAGTVQLRFAPEVVPYVTRLEKEFTSYRLARIGSMSSPNAIRLYELLLQYVSIGSREIEVEAFKTLLGLEGKYAKFSMLQKFVIDPSVEQINEVSDIQVDWKPRKTGRKFSHLSFTMRFKQPPKIAEPEPEPEPEPESEAPSEEAPKAGEPKAERGQASADGYLGFVLSNLKMSESEFAAASSPGESIKESFERIKRERREDLGFE
ncbi:Replication initiation protein [compost metagenome]